MSDSLLIQLAGALASLLAYAVVFGVVPSLILRRKMANAGAIDELIHTTTVDQELSSSQDSASLRSGNDDKDWLLFSAVLGKRICYVYSTPIFLGIGFVSAVWGMLLAEDLFNRQENLLQLLVAGAIQWIFLLILVVYFCHRVYRRVPLIARHAFCLRCQYDRTGLPYSSPCPECGFTGRFKVRVPEFKVAADRAFERGAVDDADVDLFD